MTSTEDAALIARMEQEEFVGRGVQVENNRLLQ